VAGEDNRESLPSVFATRYIAGGVFDGGTDLIAWRDKLGIGVSTGASCATGPSPAVPGANSQEQIAVFDEEENPITQGRGPSGFTPPEDNPFPFCTNRASVGTDITIAEDFGWIFLNLNTADSIFHQQAYVTTVMSALGRFSVGFDAIALNSLTEGSDQVRGPRNTDPTVGTYPHGNPPTLFSGGLSGGIGLP
jgi:hypothetical protein